MDISRAASEALKVWIAFGGVALVVLWNDLARKRALAALAGLTLFAALNYARFGPRTLVEEIDSYDVLHYYISAKYFDQVGYFDLYPAILLADREHPKGPYHPKLRRYRAQNRDDGYLGLRSVQEAYRRGQQVRAKFSASEWEEFRHDVHHLMRDYNFSRGYFETMMGDRGFNGTPVWLLLARPFAKWVDVGWIKFLCYLDLLWLVVALGFVRWAYRDWVPVLWTTFFLCVTYSLRWPVPGQVFLRYDWVALLVITMALLRRGHPLLAGMTAAGPALLRFFPAVWMFGPAARGVIRVFAPGRVQSTPGPTYWGGRLSRSQLLMAAGFLATALTLEGAAVARYGTQSVQDHVTNIVHHIQPEELSSRRMGLAIGMSHDGAKLPKYISNEQKERVAEQKNLRLALSALLLLGLGWGARRLRDDEAYALGFLPFFFLSTFSYYYAVARITLIVWHASDLRVERNRIGLALLFALEMFSNYSETQFSGHRVYLVGHLSWGLSAYALLMIGWLLYESHKNQTLLVRANAPRRETEERDDERDEERDEERDDERDEGKAGENTGAEPSGPNLRG